jgi:cystathionine beta-lyase/cystathionine gamma-synthase
VHYPGLASHPRHKLVQQVFSRGAGGMLAFEVATGAAADAVLQVRVRVRACVCCCAAAAEQWTHM